MIKTLLISIAIFISSLVFSQEGEYVFKTKKDAGPSGLVLVHKPENGAFRFYLEFFVGEPSYNSNAFYGRLEEVNASTFKYVGIPEILFFFTSDFKAVEVKGDIRGSTTYTKISSVNPQCFITRTGKKVFFETTSPEDEWE
ncbi:MAG: hypothetical protein HUJ25_02700 [Crocinitomicaceae bacterium]|nr:hypothetical protein [Crocinitomicaceae bacterium]